MLSLYRDEPTWLHTIPAWLKLLLLALLASGLFLTQRPGIVLPVSGAACTVLWTLRPIPAGTCRLLVSVVLSAILLAAFHAYQQRPVFGISGAARLIAMTSLGIALTLSTRHTDMVEAVEQLLRPLRCLGVRADRLGFQIALMLRFTEHFFCQWKRLDDAHRTRTGARGGLRLLAPLTIQMLSAALRVSDALSVRLGR